jgi:hypothetical protein
VTGPLLDIVASAAVAICLSLQIQRVWRGWYAASRSAAPLDLRCPRTLRCPRLIVSNAQLNGRSLSRFRPLVKHLSLCYTLRVATLLSSDIVPMTPRRHGEALA